MKHEVFILGGQRIDQKSKKGWKRGLGEMREGRRERMRKGAIVSSSPRQKLQNSKVYAKYPEFSPVLGLIIFRKKSVATGLR